MLCLEHHWSSACGSYYFTSYNSHLQHRDTALPWHKEERGWGKHWTKDLR